MKSRSIWILAALSCACSSEEKPFIAPAVTLRLTLPEGLALGAVPCLDLILASPNGAPPATSIGFGADPLFLKVQTLDVDNDGRPETRVRFTQGSTPFLARTTNIVISAGAGTDPNATLAVTAIARLADGTLAADDRCLGGTALAQGQAAQDTAGQPIRFPKTGETVVEVPMTCVRAAGCDLTAPDGGAPDAGTPTDGGAPEDGGAADGG